MCKGAKMLQHVGPHPWEQPPLTVALSGETQIGVWQEKAIKTLRRTQ